MGRMGVGIFGSNSSCNRGMIMDKGVLAILMMCLIATGCVTSHERDVGTYKQPLSVYEFTFEGNQEEVDSARSEIERISKSHDLTQISANRSLDDLLDDNDIFMDFYHAKEPSDFTLGVTGLKNEIVLTFISTNDEFKKLKKNSSFNLLLADLIGRLENIFGKPPNIGRNDKLWRRLRE